MPSKKAFRIRNAPVRFSFACISLFLLPVGCMEDTSHEFGVYESDSATKVFAFQDDKFYFGLPVEGSYAQALEQMGQSPLSNSEKCIEFLGFSFLRGGVSGSSCGDLTFLVNKETGRYFGVCSKKESQCRYSEIDEVLITYAVRRGGIQEFTLWPDREDSVRFSHVIGRRIQIQ